MAKSTRYQVLYVNIKTGKMETENFIRKKEAQKRLKEVRADKRYKEESLWDTRSNPITKAMGL